MPDECASMRSMARWVLPVLVGPRTAVTPAPRARGERLEGEENDRVITRPNWRRGHRVRPGAAFLYHNATAAMLSGARELSFGTSLERIAPESLTRTQYGFVHGDIWPPRLPSPQDQVSEAGIKARKRPEFVNGHGDHPGRASQALRMRAASRPQTKKGRRDARPRLYLSV